jgi:outer membrane protein
MLASAGAPEVRPPLRLTAVQTLELASRAEQHGNVEIAKQAYSALARDPNVEIRAEAMFRHGRMLAEAGKLDEAAKLFRRVLDERPDATLVRLEFAQVLNRLGDNAQALRELRAVQATRLPASVARLVDRFSEALRAARPMGASIEVAVAPDSNISRATRTDTLRTIFGEFEIDEDGKAKSGIGLSLSGQAYRRLPLGESDHSVLLNLNGAADLYRKMKFSDLALDVSGGPELQLGRSRLNVEAGATQRWYGLKPYVRSARLGATWRRPVGDRSQIQLAGSTGLVDHQANDLQDGKFHSGQIGFEHALSPTMGVGLSLGTDRMAAKDPAYSTTNRRAGVFGWRDLGRMTVTLAAEFGRLKADDRLLLLPEVRADRLTRLTLGATFRQFTFAGFAPVSRLVIERNRSSVEFYDYSRTHTEIGIVRAF